VGGARRRDEGDAPGERGIRDGEAALPAGRAPEDETRRRHAPGPPSKTGVLVRARAGLLALGSSYSPRLPGLAASGSPAGFVPDYSDGVAAAFNRLPWALRGIPGREQRADGSRIARAAQRARQALRRPRTASGAPVLGPAGLIATMIDLGWVAPEKGVRFGKGGRVNPLGPQVTITQVRAEHSSEVTVVDPVTKKSTTYPGGEPCGFIVEFENG